MDRAGLKKARDYFATVVDSAEYRAGFEARAKNGLLAPAVETRMLEYVFGKVPDRVELTDDDGAR